MTAPQEKDYLKGCKSTSVNLHKKPRPGVSKMGKMQAVP